MAQNPAVVIHFKDCEQDEKIRDSIEKHSARLAKEFHEINQFEVSLEPSGPGFIAHVHVTGKGTDASTQANASELGPAADLIFHKVERQLRKIHDKRIFGQRREAQRDRDRRES
jgi:ribosomal subunit interface protein